jgi:serine/threonine protein kinase
LTRIESSAFSSSSLQSIVIPRNVEILCSSCFSSCHSLSSITFESDSRLKRIDAHAFEQTALRSVVIPPTVCSITCDAFPGDCQISVLSCNLCPELEQWCSGRDRDSTIDFRRIMRLGSGVPCLSECLLDLSVFERSQSVGVANQGQCELYRRLSDGFEIVVKLIVRFDDKNSSESENRLEIRNAIEKLMNLRYPCVAAPLGFIISSNWTELKIARAYARIGSLEEVLQTSPLWWTATEKSIAVVGIVLGMKFVHSFGMVCGNLKPTNILFDESHRIQIVDIIPNWAESHCRGNSDGSGQRATGAPSEFAAPEVLSGGKLTQKSDVFAFASILFSIVVGHRRFGEAGAQGGHAERPLIVGDTFPGFVPYWVCRLIRSGLSTDPGDRPSFHEIMKVLKNNDFGIAKEVNSEAVSAFVSWMESSER